MQNSIGKRLQLLRTEMRDKQVDIYIIPSIDAHNSEYVPSCFERRAWISGFTGSAGEVVVTLEHAYLWTDGRYFLQANQQLDAKHYTLMKQTGFVPEVPAWLASNASGKKLGVDPSLISIGRANDLKRILHDVGGEFVVIEDNLVDKCKLKLGEKLSMPQTQAFALDIKYTGESVDMRLTMLRDVLAKNNAEFIALNVLDEIAWLFNIRGADIEFNPLVISYALISHKKAWLFVDKQKINQELQQTLTKAGVSIVAYEGFGEHLAKIKSSIWLDDKTANYAMLSKVSDKATIVFGRSPIILKKACKNAVEASGSKYAHTKDAVAVINFLAWLDKSWKSGIDEISAADKLAEFRGQQENLLGASFATISGFAGNGAIIHYRANEATVKTIDDSNLYLIDSGGQYLEGTTDITRTVHLGKPTKEQKRHYTLVLKGHLALGRAIFPQGTFGEHLDALARSPLWSEYLNYRHGTGHGVGSFLCVHEGPQKISSAPSGVSLLPGMIVSNEPGLYIADSHGIRIENLCLISELKSREASLSEYGPFYAFEDLTLVPYAKKLIDVKMLSDEDKAQIKRYYKKIKTKVRTLLSKKERIWLDNELDLF
jgi:Xaa-Pro aminopeptidase